MNWKFSGTKPVYQQIMDTIQSAVLAGEFLPGEKFPSVRELATAATVNPNTMQRALQELERQGLLVTDGTNGRYITRDPQVIESLRGSCLDQLIRECISKFWGLGISPEEAAKLLTQKEV